MKRSLWSVLFVFLLAGFAANAHAAVEYVKICPLYGPFYYYLPDTDICVNARTGDMRKQTEGGTFRTWMPGEKTLVRQPRAACKQGRLEKVGTFTPADFTITRFTTNSGDSTLARGVYSTSSAPLSLVDDEVISNVIFTGGIDDNSLGSLCLQYFQAGVDLYSPVACQDTRDSMTGPPVSFNAIIRSPTTPFSAPFSLRLTTGELVSEQTLFTGSISAWVCIQGSNPRF
jgi:hypothetical protein